ncbi:MAG TPA: hypothetical protein PK514_12610 [Spirochaetota bacterium]|nr:hypothetical protein [Spirochaetota bacterium]
MPFTQDDLYNLPISFERENETTVLVGPCSGKAYKGKKIPLDGRHYKCGGTIILKNSRKFRASLSIQTHTFDFLELDDTYIFYNDVWYKWDEKEFLEIINETEKSAFPFKWIPDIPLDYHDKGPYPMSFYQINK